MLNEDNRDEVIALYYTAKEFGQSPSDYAFGDRIPPQAKYEIDFRILCIGREHEAEQHREATQKAAHP